MGKEIDVYGSAENPLFKAKDVAEWIEHSTITRMLELVDNEEKGVYQLSTPGGNQNVWFLTEDGLYEVLMQSRKPIAKQFKKGIKDILKSIRKTGSYSVKKEENIFFSIASIIKLRIFAALSHIQRRTEACFLDRHFLCLKSNVANIAAVHPVLLLNGVATAFEVCDNGGPWTAVFSCPIMP